MVERELLLLLCFVLLCSFVLFCFVRHWSVDGPWIWLGVKCIYVCPCVLCSCVCVCVWQQRRPNGWDGPRGALLGLSRATRWYLSKCVMCIWSCMYNKTQTYLRVCACVLHAGACSDKQDHPQRWRMLLCSKCVNLVGTEYWLPIMYPFEPQIMVCVYHSCFVLIKKFILWRTKGSFPCSMIDGGSRGSESRLRFSSCNKLSTCTQLAFRKSTKSIQKQSP